MTVREIYEILGMSHGSVVAHLRNVGYVSRMNVCVPRELSDRNLQQCLDA